MDMSLNNLCEMVKNKEACGAAVHGVLKARILKWFAIPFSSGPRFVMTRPSWVTLPSMAHSFIELYRAVVHVISLISFL